LKIKILGTKGEIKEYSKDHKKHSGILIGNILFDIGEEEFLKYKPKAIFITHLHPDHAYFVKDKKEIKYKGNIYSPEEYNNVKKIKNPIKIDKYKITPIPTIHSKKVKSNAYLIENSYKILYTGDMIWINKKYHNKIKNCDLVITDGSSFDRDLIRKDKKTGEIYGHSSIPKLVKLFKNLNAKSIIITHFGKYMIEKPKEYIRKILELEDSKIHIAKDGREFNMKSLQLKPEDVKDITPKNIYKIKTGLYLVPPHGELIYNGEKTLIVKTKNFKKHIKEDLILLSGNKAYGIIYLEEPKKISKEEFDKLVDKHKISQEEYEDWNWKEPLYAYEFRFSKFNVPIPVKIPKGVQIFVNIDKVKFLTPKELSNLEIEEYHAYLHYLSKKCITCEISNKHIKIVQEFRRRKLKHVVRDILDRIEELIRDHKKILRNPDIVKKLDKRILLDDHRILWAWLSRIKKGKKLMSEQFKEYSLNEQKDVVIELLKIYRKEMRRRGFKVKLRKEGKEKLFELPPGMALKDIDISYVTSLSDKELISLYKWLHEIYKKEGIFEDLVNSHVFVGIELYKRDLYFDNKIEDKLTDITEDEILEYKSPGEAILKEPEEYITIEELYNALPNNIIVPGQPYAIYQTGRIANIGRIPKDHDLDWVFRQYPDRRVIEAIKRIYPKWLSKRIHPVFDPSGPLIGFSYPLYRYGFFKVSKEEFVRGFGPYRISRKELKEEVKPFMRFRALKAKAGWEKYEFWNYEDFYKNWASKYLDRGIVIQKKYDGRRFTIHKQGDKVQIITEDRMRDRSNVMEDIAKEIKKIPHDFVLDTEAVEYNCKNIVPKTADAKEIICEEIPREDTASLTVGDLPIEEEKKVVFHVHDILYLDGKSLNNLGYYERFKKLKEVIPKKSFYINIVQSSDIIKTPRELAKAVNKYRRLKGSEGIMAKVADSKYPIKKEGENRTSEWCLTGENYLLGERGFMRVDHLKPGDKVFSKDGKLHRILRIAKRRIYKNEKLFDIKPRKGFQIRLTGNHEVLANPEGWVPTQNLALHILEYPKLKIPKEKAPESLFLECHGHKKKITCNSDFWRLIGFWLAEGSIGSNRNKIYKRGEFKLSKKNRRTIEKYAQIWKNLFGIMPKIYSCKINHLIVWDKPFCEWLSKYFLDTSGNKTVPWFIAALSKEKFNSFLEGYLEGDGRIEKRNNRMGFSSSDPGLAGRLFAILKSKDIEVNVSYSKPKKGKGVFAFRFYRTEVPNQVEVKRVYTDYKDFVYDLEIENENSYLSSAVVLHNSKLKNLKSIDVIVYKIIPKKKKTGEIIPGVWQYDTAVSIPPEEIPKWRKSDLVTIKGKIYAKIGRTFSTSVKCKVGDIVEVLVGRIREYTTKDNKHFITWMFPKFREKRTDKKEPDSLDVARKLAKVGPGEIVEKLFKLVNIKLKHCPFYKDKSICPLKKRFGIPRIHRLSTIRMEYLKYPIACPLANIYRCVYVKSYYYGTKEWRRKSLR